LRSGRKAFLNVFSHISLFNEIQRNSTDVIRTGPKRVREGNCFKSGGKPFLCYFHDFNVFLKIQRSKAEANYNSDKDGPDSKIGGI